MSPREMETAAQVQRNPFVPKDGYLPIPTAPGLGLDLDEEALGRFAYQQFPQRRIRTPEEEGPFIP